MTDTPDHRTNSSAPAAASGDVATAAPTVAAGWYGDPQDAAQIRYWDGTAWTDHVQAVPGAAAPAATAPVTATSVFDTPEFATPTKRRRSKGTVIGRVVGTVVLLAIVTGVVAFATGRLQDGLNSFAGGDTNQDVAPANGGDADSASGHGDPAPGTETVVFGGGEFGIDVPTSWSPTVAPPGVESVYQEVGEYIGTWDVSGDLRTMAILVTIETPGTDAMLQNSIHSGLATALASYGEDTSGLVPSEDFDTTPQGLRRLSDHMNADLGGVDLGMALQAVNLGDSLLYVTFVGPDDSADLLAQATAVSDSVRSSAGE